MRICSSKCEKGFRVQGSAGPLAKKTAGLIEQETK